MRKYFLILVHALFINAAFAQSYIEPLNKLNKYLQAGKSFFVKQIEVKDEDIYIYNSYNDHFKKAKISDLRAAVVPNRSSSVAINCNDGTKCVYYSLTKRKSAYFDFYVTDSAIRLELVALINDFISSYDKDFGITYVPPKTSGCLLGDCENGTGKYVYADSSEYYGKWENSKRNGKGVLYKKDKIEISGNWENDVLSKGEIKYANKFIYEGSIKDDLPNGEGETYYSDAFSKIKYKGTYKDGLLNGKGEYYNVLLDSKYERKEERYIGNWKDGQYDGLGMYTLTSHYPKAQKKGMDDMVSYDGYWKAGKKDGAGTYISNNTDAQEYTGDWKNDLKEGRGKCIYKTDERYQDGGTVKDVEIFEGTWLAGKQFEGKLTTATGIILYEGGEKERNMYVARTWQEKKRSDSIANAYYINSGQAERDRKEREDRAARNVQNAQNENNAKSVCVCDRCGGSGKISFKSFKTWEISNGVDKYGNAKTIKKSGYVDEEQTCTRCLGSGKCK